MINRYDIRVEYPESRHHDFVVAEESLDAARKKAEERIRQSVEVRRIEWRGAVAFVNRLPLILAVLYSLGACAAESPPMRPHWKYTCTNADTVQVPVAVLHEDDEYNPLVVLKVPLVFCVRRDSVWIEPELEKDDTLDAAMIPKDSAR